MNFHAKLYKRHNTLYFHRVRELTTAGVYRFHYLPGELHPEDVLSKYWSYSGIWKLLCPLMFWYGDTADIPID